MNWFVNIFRRGRNEELRVGSRITTKIGTGIVVGGGVNIRYPQDVLMRHNKARGIENYQDTWCHNLKEFN